uniref:Uncharacterized protein n=1 Tax=Rhizophora mucronata TaxID=61149 RepID=A0A2P2JNT9_RHIMU
MSSYLSLYQNCWFIRQLLSIIGTNVVCHSDY